MTENYTLITGASSGIGKEIAKVCAKRGMNLLIISYPDELLSATVTELRNNYPIKVDSLAIDLSKTEAPKEVFAWCQEKNYSVHVLINNIGLGGRVNFDSDPVDDIHKLLFLNVHVCTLLTRLFINDLVSHKESHILNVSSMASFFPLPHKAVYSAAKAYIYAFTRALSNELRHKGVHISVICPGGSEHTKDPVVQQKVSGFLSKTFHHSPQQIAELAVDGMLKKKRVIIPGLFPKFYSTVAHFLPRFVVDAFVGSLFRPKAEG